MKEQSKVRQSNFELLRIVAMLMILVVHFDGAALGLPSPAQPWAVTDWVKTCVEALSIVGVNLFVMISGYFGIRLSGRRLMAYIGMCLFYSAGIYIVWVGLTGQRALSAEGWQKALLVFSHGDLWFIRDYLMLMLVAPLVNAGMQTLERRSLNRLMVALVVINCYFGWWWEGKVNPTGYCLTQLVSVYILGHWLRGVRLSGFASFLIWLAGYALIIVMARHMPAAKAYAYNSPAVVIASVGLFMLFARMRLSSRAVNAMASHTFAVYLLHKDPYIWHFLKFDVIEPLYNHTNGVYFMLYITLLTVAVYAAAISIDCVRAANVRFISQIVRNVKNGFKS